MAGTNRREEGKERIPPSRALIKLSCRRATGPEERYGKERASLETVAAILFVV
jgi:hypothetical protein